MVLRDMDRNRFRRKWLASFAAGVSHEDIKTYVKEYGNYIWHVFSWELLDKERYLSGDAARAAFDAADRQGAVCIEWFTDKWTRYIDPGMTAADIERKTEIYIAAADFSWTYIKTHEKTCGPYFMAKAKHPRR